MEGHRKYRLEGMGPVPRAIAEATQEYQSEMDTFGDFLDECLTPKVPNAWTPRPQLWKRYQEWAKDSGIPQRQWLRRNTFYLPISTRRSDMVNVRNADNEYLGAWGGRRLVIGSVNEVNGPGAQEIPDFMPNRHELIQLTKYRAGEAVRIRWFEFFRGAQVAGKPA